MDLFIDNGEATNNKQNALGEAQRDFRLIKGGDYNWQNFTKLANESFKNGQVEQALHYYKRALGEAEMLFEAAMAGEGKDSAPMLFNISCHNLAALEMWRNNQLAADYYYYEAYNRLLNIAAAVDSLPNLRLACVQHLKISLIALVDHLLKQHASSEHIAQLKCDAARVALNVYHVAEHLAKAKQDCPHCLTE